MKTVWVFDVDGVITNLQTRQIAGPQILDKLIKILELKEPIAFITGRGHKWIIERVIDKLENKIGNKSLLNNVFISEEFGGIQSFYENGLRIDLDNENFSIPPEVFIMVKKITDSEFSDSMFNDPKKTMISIEMQKNFPMDKFKLLQKELILKIKEVLKKYDRDQRLEIHKDHIATNIKNKNSSKKYATRQMIDWLSKKRIIPNKFIVFGDNISDKEIADELFEKGLVVEFIFVGNKNELGNNSQNYKIIIKNNKFEKGTLEFLESL